MSLSDDPNGGQHYDPRPFPRRATTLERLSDERIHDCAACGGSATAGEVERMARELRDRRAAEAKGWECVKLLWNNFVNIPQDFGPYTQRNARVQVKQAARAAGINLD
jgi:hypothetical protein